MKKSTQFVMIAISLLISFNAFCIPKLNSNPGSAYTIFLDFDGHTVTSSFWNGGNTIYCAPAVMTDAQITEAFNRCAEDYRPFDITVTTDSMVFLATQLTKRMRVIVTPTSAWMPNVGGVAWVGSFDWGDDTPCFVFSDRLGPNSPKMVGECCSHESGHTVGLSHQSKYVVGDCVNPTEPYNGGFGGGQVGWAPIMGNSYYKNMSNWNNGPTPSGCNSIQDNLSIITTQNGFNYRPDEYPEAMNASTYTLNPSNFNVEGIITTTSDKDAFRFVLSRNSNFHLTAIPFNVGANYIGANLDIKMELYNAGGTLIRAYDPSTTMGITVDTVLNTGTYYIKIDGTGNINIGEYGSLGAYSLGGVSSALPIRDVTLSGNVDKNRHNLNWKIIADEPIKTILLESSTDGTNFKSLTNVDAAATNFSYLPYQTNTVFYRLRVTSVIDESVYSNTIALKGTDAPGKSFSVSTLVHHEISVNASVNFQYLLTDINGKRIATGNGNKGIHKINVSNQPGGMYILQLFNDNEKQTERIIKQ